MNNKWRIAIAVFVGLVVSAGLAEAQRTTANIYGIVKDSSGAVVPGIKAQLINELTGAEQVVSTNESGEFAATFLPVGRYTIRVETQGFKTFIQRGLELAAGQQIRYPIALQVGEVTQTMEVVAEAPQIQNASVALADSVTKLQLEELPMSRRDFTQLLTLQNGVVRTSQELLQVNGLASGGITVTTDGVDAAGDPETPSVSMFQGQNQINVLSQEAIQEVVVSKGVISAEIGRTYSGNINLITKSGTNEFHGSLFENWQNDALNARYALLAPTARKPPIRFHQFGGSAGGPVIKNKAFFFFAYEGYRQSNFGVQTTRVPTPEFKAQAVAAVPAYKSILDLFPAPTDSYAPGTANAFWQGSLFDQAHDNHIVMRGDYNIRDADRLSARYTRGRPFRLQPRSVLGNQRSYEYATDSANLSWVHSAATWTSETRLGANYSDSNRIDAIFPQGIAGIDVQGNFGTDGEHLKLTGHTYSAEEIVAKTMGRHTIKSGGTYVAQAPGRYDEETPVYRYSNPADFLANRPNRVQFTFGVPRYYAKSWNLAGFIQDDFKVSSRLVLNLGVRYEYYSVFRDKDGLLFNPGNPLNAVSVPPRFRPADSGYDSDKNNFLPRVGLAWSLDSEGKTVVRSGFGMSVAPQNLRNFSQMFAYGPNVLFRYRFTGSDITNLGLKYPLGNAEALQIVQNQVVAKSFEIFDERNPNPYAMQWSLDIQRQLASTLVFQTGYVGTRGLKVTMSHNINQPDRVTNVRPFPGALESLYKDASDNSAYHAWQSSLRKRLSNDLSFNVNYTYSKTLAISKGDFWPGEDTRAQDEKNFAENWGRHAQDRTHVFVWDLVYNAPFDRWLNANSALRHVAGGWQVAGIFTAASGGPLEVSQPSSTDSARPDYIGGDPYLRGSNRFQYLNPAAFARVPTGPGGATIRPGNLGKNALSAPGSWNVNFSLAKEFKFVERYSLRFRADMFNALNHANLGGPITDIRQADFGLIRTVSGARTIQLGVRFAF